jgi:hypothetical protein
MTLVEHGVIGGAQGIGLVLERQFDLSRREFRNRAFERYVR